MPETFQDNQIATGHNNTAGLTNIEAILVDGNYFVAADDLGNWSFGTPVLYGDQTNGTQGIASTSWISGNITFAQYNYIYTTLLGGSISGRVTVRTRVNTPGTYANYNAILTIKSPAEIRANKTAVGYINFVWEFTGMTLIP